MAKTLISVRIEKELKDKILDIAKKLDLTFSQAMNLVLKTNSSELNKIILEDKNG